jgi:hypothetical protein
VEDFYSHGIGGKLLNISGVKRELEFRAKSQQQFDVNWHTVRDWTEKSRYDHSISETKARILYDAVSDPNSGVLPWLKTQW